MSLASLALWRRDRRSPWWSWELCDFNVTSSCDVISPDHFVRGFYNSSFRRCRPNFLVLQKEYKILVHNLSIYVKLEQSTHWIIQKKCGKDFTFGSDCTVVPAWTLTSENASFGVCASWWSHQLTSDPKSCLLFWKCLQCSCLKAVSVPTFVIGGLWDSTATSGSCWPLLKYMWESRVIDLRIWDK